MPSTVLSNNDGATMPKNKNTYQGKLISETMPNGLFTLDPKWMVLSWNKAAGELSGVKAVDIIGRNLWEAFEGKIPIPLYNAYHQALLHDVPVYFEGYWPQTGTLYEMITCYYEETLAVAFKKKYPPVYEHPAQQLKVLHELYQYVTQVTNDCLWEWDFRNKEIFWIDGGHKKVFGLPVENALIPQLFWEIRIHPDDKVRVLTRLRAMLAESSAIIWEDEYRFQKANGEYAYVHDRGHIIYDDNGASRMIGATQDITAKRLAQQQLAETESSLIQERLNRQKEITYAVLTAQEQEREGIGKELHDNLNQMLGAAKLYIELAKTDESMRELCLTKSSGFIMEVIEHIRKIAKSLLPPIMMMGLEDSVKHLIFDLIQTHPIKIDFREIYPEGQHPDEKLQLTIFRIIQEQLNNIVKHSKASHASINVAATESAIELLIIDNGQGCDMSADKEGIGIRNIISRVELYQGTVITESKPGEGFALKVFFPLPVVSLRTITNLK